MIIRLTARAGWCGIIAVVAQSWFSAAHAQEVETGKHGSQSAPAEAGNRNSMLRTYDVSHLIINIEDRPFRNSLALPNNRDGWGGGGEFGGGGGGFGGGGGGGFFSVPGEADGASRAKRGAMKRFESLGGPAGMTRRVQFAQFGGEGGAAMAAGGATDMVTGEGGPSANIRIPDIIRVITNTIAADTWVVNGGDGQIEPLGTSLIVWQANHVHEQIGVLLRQLETVAAGHRTVTIDARWLMLTSDELEDLLVADQKGVPQVNREQLARLTRRPGSLRGITSCLSSQLVFIVSGTMKNIVSGYIPVVGSSESPEDEVQLAGNPGGVRIQLVDQTTPAVAQGRGSVGYQPIGQSLNFGALLVIRPTLMPANSDAPVLVDLKSTVTVEAEAGQAKGEAAPAVDRVAVDTMEFATTLRMPAKTPVLVGGMTHIPSSSAQRDRGMAAPEGGEETVAAERPQLYLVLEVR